MRLQSFPSQDCPAQTANDDASVIYLTLSTDGQIDQDRRTAIDRLVREQRGSSVWRSSERIGRSYALVELPDESGAPRIRAAWGAVVHDHPIIALALFPTVPEALPHLLEALGGSGRPAGIFACSSISGGLVVEWDPAVTRADVVLAVADVELRRFAGGRTAELLSPLPPSLVASIAAEGLQAPQVAPERILEMRIE